MQKIAIKSVTIKLDQFLKWATIVNSGGEAKQVIQNGLVKVNGQLVTERGKVLNKGDVVCVAEGQYQVN